MIIYRIIFLYSFCTFLFGQSKSHEPIFQWKHSTGTSNALIQKISLDWLEERRKSQVLEVFSITKNPYSVSFKEEILIRRYKRDDFITVDYDITITGENEELIFEVTDLDIYLHDIIKDETVKKYEWHEVKQLLKEISKELVEYIINSERSFIKKLDDGLLKSNK